VCHRYSRPVINGMNEYRTIVSINTLVHIHNRYNLILLFTVIGVIYGEQDRTDVAPVSSQFFVHTHCAHPLCT
jgi:hypothetical protein